MPKTSPYCRVLMLHRKEDKQNQTSGISLSWLEDSIRQFKARGYEFINLRTFQACLSTRSKFPSKSILVTLDDGYADQVEELTPIFLKHDIEPVVFLITDFVSEAKLPWDERIRLLINNANQGKTSFEHLGGWLHYEFDSERSRKYARTDFIQRCELLPEETRDEAIDLFEKSLNNSIQEQQLCYSSPASMSTIRKLSNQGVVFANHTATHMIAGSETKQQFKENLLRAQEFLDVLGLNRDTFAFAVGKPHSIGCSEMLVKSLHYTTVFNAIEGMVHYKHNSISLNRIPYPESQTALDDICSPLAPYKYADGNFLIFINDLIKLKFLIYRYGGKAASLTWLQQQIALYTGQLNDLQRIDFGRVRRLVFVCLGNINRSALGQAIFEKSSAVPCASFGLRTDSGFPPSIELQRWARANNIDVMRHKTTRLEDFEVCDGDLLVAFEPEHVARLKERYSNNVIDYQITLAGLWSAPKRVYIHDPVARPEQYFDRCFSIIRSGVEQLARQLT